MSQKQFRVLALFDYHSFTGFATVSQNLVREWKKILGQNMKLDIVGINYFGEDYNESENIRVISAERKDIRKYSFGRYVFLATLHKNDYELVFILQDIGIVKSMLPELIKIKQGKKEANKKQFKSMFYFPVDFELNPSMVEGLEFFDYLATYTHWGRNMILEHRPELKGKIQVVHHGNNPKDFYPLPEEEKKAFRKSYFGEGNAHKFIIGNINRNQPRKDIPSTILGFERYWRYENKNSFLYLHMNPVDPMGWKLRTILNQTNLIEGTDYMFPPEDDYNKGADIEKLNRIYNSLDVFLTTATAEGWGLSVTEAMACKIPVLAPNHTSLREILDDGRRGYLCTELNPVVAVMDNVIRNGVSLWEVSSELHDINLEINQETESHQSKINAAYRFVQSLNWHDIAKRFANEMKRLA
jgi:glycosyltransferase involved in cell wall biosynthesis